MVRLGNPLQPLAFLACFVTAQAHAQQSVVNDSAGTVETSGFAQLTLQPTRAVITFAVATRAVSAAQAASLNGPRTKRLLAALSASHPAPDSVLVIGVNVGPNENEENGTLVDYQARSVLRLVVTALDSLGRYLDIALTHGATEVSDVDYTSDSVEVAGQRALAQAYGAAYAKAKALAEAAGGNLGPLLRLSTGPEYGALRRDFASTNAASYSGGFAVPVTAQGVSVSASVSAVWRFVPRR